MFVNVKHSFVGLASGGLDPSKIPDYYGPYYDKALALIRLFPHFGAGTKEIHENFWPIICLLAQQWERLDKLENMLSGGVEVEVTTQPDPVPEVDVPAQPEAQTADVVPPSPNAKVDKRTKAYKESQKKMELAGVA